MVKEAIKRKSAVLKTAIVNEFVDAHFAAAPGVIVFPLNSFSEGLIYIEFSLFLSRALSTTCPGISKEGTKLMFQKPVVDTCVSQSLLFLTRSRIMPRRGKLIPCVELKSHFPRNNVSSNFFFRKTANPPWLSDLDSNKGKDK